MSKIFLIEWSAPNLGEVAKNLQQNGCEILYWTGGTSRKDEFPKTIFHSSFDAVKAIPPEEVNTINFEPLGKEIIEKFFACESITMTMMNRIDYSKVHFMRRKRLYYDLLKYWRGVLKSMNPDAVIFSTTPHLVYDFVLYSVCKEFGIKTLVFMLTRIPDRYLLARDIKIGSEKLIAEIAKGHNYKLEDLSKDIRDYYIFQTSPSEVSKFPYKTVHELDQVARSLKAPSIGKVLSSIKDGSIARRGRAYFKRLFSAESGLLSFDPDYKGIDYEVKLREWATAKKLFEKEYRNLQVEVDWNKKFIYAPLQYQPERSTSPEGGIFTDQFLMFDILSNSIPDDWVIYAKEHLSQWTKGGVHAHQGRYAGYYKKLSSYRNVYLVPPEILSNKFIERCQCVATVAGTGSWEAVLNGKPSMVFGYPSYKDCSEIFKIYDIIASRSAMGKVISGYKPDRQKVLNYLGAFDRVSIRASIEQGIEKNFAYSMDLSSQNIKEAILNEF
ncbi:MAG: hypothetical protein A3B96_01200 [Candidatus Spechtbacteria bacterium RIFCSPHIGHO2_02_FULL_43_15b]|uniref:Capsule polysaccharide biosynthesis protein n=1 Tax=Candidatus Spechtbacteria bacterium RIFCSPHIGHO2_01_FULL_43_30 TaxID=1802158 RepID=A0A1G2H4F0_9BACT|nr:MAG: hypothetical protein A2827_03600 [Candidatus Spechtbacteria bacterium RIFCSPHIGHO2_01_FULL_43_30]OGZ59029.1 MAG: hypothetical protein A3B96_01200 [Candidatus Spechtbacteria bacterium RIFCSPHIGHO2_02_FULL_43_15b]